MRGKVSLSVKSPQLSRPCRAMRRSRPLDLKPLSAVQEGVRQVKEHVAMDGTSAEPPERRSRTHMAVSPPGMPCRLSHLSKPSRNWHLAKREPSGSPPASVPTQWIVAWAFNGVPISRAKAKTPRPSGNPSTMRNPSTERPLRYGEFQVAWVLKCQRKP